MQESNGHGAESVEDVFAELIRRAEAGEQIDASEFCARYPQWSDDIAEFLAGRADLERFAKQLRDATTPITVDPPGTRVRYIGDYELLELIGRGGMGHVYRARQVSLNRLVAVKLFSDSQYDRSRFEAETRAAALLHHPNIISIYETGEHDGRLYYAMQLVEGGDLLQRIEQRPIPPEQAVELARKLAAAVQYAHDRGVLHRDLKPANVLLDANNQPHIADFGLAKLIDRDTQLTRSGAVLGTPAYMAPEQAAGDASSVTTLTDVYGLGATLYVMLTGRSPFSGPTSAAVLRKVQDEPVESPRSICHSAPRDLETICLKCLEKRPAQRYRSAQELADDLGRFACGEPIRARPVSQTERFWRWCRRKPAAAGLAAALIAVLVLTAVGGTVLAARERLARHRESLLDESRLVAMRQAETNLIDLYTDKGRNDRFEKAFTSESALWYAHAAVQAIDHAGRSRVAWVRASSADRRTPDPVFATLFPEQIVRSLEFHPDGTHLLVRTDDGRLYVPEVKPSSIPASLFEEKVVTEDAKGDADSTSWLAPLNVVDRAEAALWTPDGGRIVVGSRAGQVAVLNFPEGELVDVQSVRDDVSRLAQSADGDLVAAASGTSVHMWRLGAALEAIGSVELTAAVLHIAFHPDSERLLALSADDQVRVFAVTEAGLSSEPAFPSVPHVASNSDDGTMPSLPAFVNHGREIITQTSEQEVQCFDALNGQPARTISISSQGPWAVDPMGRRLAVSRKLGVHYWDVASGRYLRRTPHRDEAAQLCLSHDGSFIATRGLDQEVRLSRTSLDYCRANLPHHAPIDAISFSPDGRYIASAQRGGLVRAWRFNRDADLPAYRVSVGSRGSNVRVAPKEDVWIDAGSSLNDGELAAVEVRRVDTGEHSGPALAVRGSLRDAAFSRDQTLVAAVSAAKQRTGRESQAEEPGGYLSIWNWPSGDVRVDGAPLPSEPRSLDFDAAGTQLAVQLLDGDILMIDAADGAIFKRVEMPAVRSADLRDGAGEVRCSPDGRLLIAWDAAHDASVLDAASGEPKYSPLSHPAEITSTRLSGDGRYLATGSVDGYARVWNLATGELVAEPLRHHGRLYSVRFDTSGGRVITACADDNARIIEWRTGRVVTATNLHQNDVFDAMATADGRWLITAADNQLVIVSDARSGRFVDRFIFGRSVASAEAHQRRATLHLVDGGRRLIVAGGRTSITVGDINDLVREPDHSPLELYQRAEVIASKKIGPDGIAMLTVPQWCELWNSGIQGDD